MQVRLEGSHVHGRMLQPHHPPCPRPSCPGLGRMLSLWAEMTSPRGAKALKSKRKPLASPESWARLGAYVVWRLV